MDKPEFIHEKKKKKHHVWLILFFIFIGIMTFIIYTSFYNPDLTRTITGNIININKESNIKDFIIIEATLGVPGNMIIDSKANKLSLRINQPINLLIGDGNIQLEESSSIIIDNFEGKITINGDIIPELSGKADKIFINGLPIYSKSNSDLKISSENFNYNYLELEEVYLDSLSYITSGNIKISKNKILIKLNEEDFEINKFKGNIRINKNSLRLNGKLDKSNLKKLIEQNSNNLDGN